MTKIYLKRVYESAQKEDGSRILVDKLWPRGISKEDAKLDHWLKEIAPSADLRKRLHDSKDSFHEFTKKYKQELKSGEQEQALKELKDIIQEAKGPVTLLFAAKNESENNAQVLKKLIS